MLEGEIPALMRHCCVFSATVVLTSEAMFYFAIPAVISRTNLRLERIKLAPRISITSFS
jgi:hypothetical protein